MPRRITPERIEDLDTPPEGLASAAVAARRARYGANDILEAAPGGWHEVVRDSLRDPMLWFLLGTSLLFGVVGDRLEAVVLLAALVPLFGMDAWLHRRTQASIEGLSGCLAARARVIRDGSPQDIPAVDLVPGDLVELAVGDPVPADGVLLDAEELQVDESALTGESAPVRKCAAARPVAWVAGPSDEQWLLAGTRVLTGAARLAIVATGGATRYGEIVRSAIRGRHERTPLQRAVADLVRVLVYAALVICGVLAWVRMHQGHGLVDALLSAVTLAVAALPEEFPVVLTFFLGVGIYRLARRQALVRRAVVVENIGRVSCICTDKTGTLTEGRLRLAHLSCADDLAEPRLLALAALAARRETGDPMDVAIHDAAEPVERRVIATFPFTEDRKRETGIVEEDGTLVAAVKGAPETVLAMCDLDPAQAERWLRATAAFAADGHKVIAVAGRSLGAAPWTGGEPDRGYRFAGLLAFEDPVRAGVIDALRACREAGIRVIMVTGDHPATARAVAAEIGLGSDAPQVIDGAEMESRLDRPSGGDLAGVDVIARAVPAQKLRLVRALQAEGEIVAVTGDGVNDVPALQAADIGIAMGGRGTRSAREVAAIVLLDDNFRSIVRAIAEGRQLFRNLQKSFQYLLMIHLPLVVTAAAIPLAGYPLLYLPVHIVWLELVIHPTALLVFQDLVSNERLRVRGRVGPVRFFDRRQWLVILVTGLAITLVVTASYVRSLGVGYEVEHARTMALVALTLASAGITAALSRLRGRTALQMVGLTLLLAVVLVQVPWLAAALHLQPLHLDDWLLALGGALAVALIPWGAELGRRRA
jgi:Ca2+-transporting ATPase